MREPRRMPLDEFCHRHDKTRVGRWRTGDTGGSREVIVTLGRFASGDWWVESTAAHHVEVWAGAGAQEAAEERAGQLRVVGVWEPLPVDYGPDGMTPRYGA